MTISGVQWKPNTNKCFSKWLEVWSVFYTCQYHATWKLTIFIICVRSWRWDCFVNWFCYQLITKQGNKAAVPLWWDPYDDGLYCTKMSLYSIKISWLVHARRHNSNANALEVCLPCTKPPICCINECLSGYKASAGSVMILHLAYIMIGKEHNFWLIHVHQSSVNDFNIQRDMVFNKCGL